VREIPEQQADEHAYNQLHHQAPPPADGFACERM
jgi:hypothetical protein